MTTCHLCGTKMPADEIVEHIRFDHPDHWEPIEGEVEETNYEPEGLEVARITIFRRLTDDDTLDYVEAVDSAGNDLPLTEALGMLRLAEDTLIRERMDEGGA